MMNLMSMSLYQYNSVCVYTYEIDSNKESIVIRFLELFSSLVQEIQFLTKSFYCPGKEILKTLFTVPFKFGGRSGSLTFESMLQPLSGVDASVSGGEHLTEPVEGEEVVEVAALQQRSRQFLHRPMQESLLVVVFTFLALMGLLRVRRARETGGYKLHDIFSSFLYLELSSINLGNMVNIKFFTTAAASLRNGVRCK